MSIDSEDIEYEETKKFTYIKSNRKEGSNFGLTCGKFKFQICPVGIASNDTDFFIKTYFLCEKLGCLPETGGLLDQDNKTVEAFEIISNEINKHENEVVEKQKQEMEKQKRKTKTR